ncbi:MAG: DsbA family protein [Patescibacteria group bacterium]
MENNNIQKSEISDSGASSKASEFLVPIAIIIAGVLIGAGIYFSNDGDRDGKSAQQLQQTPPQKTVQTNKEDLLKNAMVLGNPNAPVIIAEFADYQCPFCGKFTNEIKPKLVEKYIKTGKALFLYHDFAFLGAESGYAGEAARCANDQGKFWQYHDYLYTYLSDNYYSKGKNGENVGALEKTNLKKFAVTLGLNAGDFNGCLDSEKYKSAVEASTELGRSLGITGTPGFIINGDIVTGALPFQEFERIIESKLK